LISGLTLAHGERSAAHLLAPDMFIVFGSWRKYLQLWHIANISAVLLAPGSLEENYLLTIKLNSAGFFTVANLQ
jgi:hypothetical protein